MLKCAADDPANQLSHAINTHPSARMSPSPRGCLLLRPFSSSYDFAIRHTRGASGCGRLLRSLTLAAVIGLLSAVLLSGADRGRAAKSAEETDLIREMKGHTERVLSVAFSPNGRYILSASQDRTLRLWSVRTGEEFLCLRGH